MNRGALALFLSLPMFGQTPDFFAAKLYPVLEAAQCRGCHAQNGVASATRLHFPEKDASAAEVQAFGLSLGILIDRDDPSKSLLLNKPTMRTPHTGGQRIKPGSDEEKLLLQWIDYLASKPAAAPVASHTAAASGQLVRRLTHSQYDNTVRDLLGDYTRPAQRFSSEDFVDGFKNQLRNQNMPPLLIEQYSAAAEKLAANAFRGGDTNGLIPCKPSSATDAKCRDQFIRSFGLRAFRRPLRESEFQRYAAAFTAQARTTGQFIDGARTIVEAMLQSPKFLFHVEAGDYAIASGLSYLLWDTLPDKALLDAAAKGDLRSPAARETWARRMLDDPRARQSLGEFFSEWLRLERVLNAAKDRRRYPDFTPEVASAMVEETHHLLDHLVWNNGNFMDLFTAGYGFLSADLAAVYKLPASQGESDMVRFPASAKRAGLLGHGSFLAASAGPVETSPTARGIFIREQLLCQHVPPPPPNVNTNLPEASEDHPSTRRQRMSEHVENAVCASCHKLMDPIGFGLENFDAIGRYRDKENFQFGTPPKRVTLPLDTTGEIAGLQNSRFADSLELGRILSGSVVCQECIVRQFFRYANGRQETSADQETIRKVSAKFRDSGFKFKELVVAVVTEATNAAK